MGSTVWQHDTSAACAFCISSSLPIKISSLGEDIQQLDSMVVIVSLYRFVTKELIDRGYNVIAMSREKAGIKGKMSKDDTVKVHEEIV